jgi:hypothetical protein
LEVVELPRFWEAIEDLFALVVRAPAREFVELRAPLFLREPDDATLFRFESAMTDSPLAERFHARRTRACSRELNGQEL